MAIASVLSRAQVGIEAPLVHVEVHLASGLPSFTIVGLPTPVVRESRERVRAALINSGFDFPPGRITVNLAPVEISKQGGRYDLPIALGVLLATGQVRAPASLKFECYGELGLGGELKPVHGLFAAALQAARAAHALIAPSANLHEVRLAGHRTAVGIDHLRDIARGLARYPAGPGPGDAPECIGAPGQADADCPEDVPQLSDVRGQWQAKRALAVAAAGAHSLLMIGPPGSGKSMLAARLPGLLPPLTDSEAQEVGSIASIGATRFEAASWRRRPFRAPHHTASVYAIVGGGARPRPGEITLAHRGVLFLDELPEFDRRVLESLREPLETGVITLARAAGRLELPAQFQLVAAMNPCPCGYLGDTLLACRCTPQRIERYRAKLSGPLLDRIDIRLEVPRIQEVADCDTGQGLARRTYEDSAAVRTQVCAARALQLRRGGCLNARLTARQLGEHCVLQRDAELLLIRSRQHLALSGRGVHRLLCISRTIADLAGSARIEPGHLAEAIQLRRPLDSALLEAAAGFGPETISARATPGSRRPA